MMGAAYLWGPLDRAPLSKLGKEAARAVGLTQSTYRAGKALLTRAPWHILEAWKREEMTTAQAYAALMEWEGTA